MEEGYYVNVHTIFSSYTFASDYREDFYIDTFRLKGIGVIQMPFTAPT